MHTIPVRHPVTNYYFSSRMYSSYYNVIICHQAFSHHDHKCEIFQSNQSKCCHSWCQHSIMFNYFHSKTIWMWGFVSEKNMTRNHLHRQSILVLLHTMNNNKCWTRVNKYVSSFFVFSFSLRFWLHFSFSIIPFRNNFFAETFRENAAYCRMEKKKKLIESAVFFDWCLILCRMLIHLYDRILKDFIQTTVKEYEFVKPKSCALVCYFRLFFPAVRPRQQVKSY